MKVSPTTTRKRRLSDQSQVNQCERTNFVAGIGGKKKEWGLNISTLFQSNKV